jgi:hypothetical protein
MPDINVEPKIHLRTNKFLQLDEMKQPRSVLDKSRRRVFLILMNCTKSKILFLTFESENFSAFMKIHRVKVAFVLAWRADGDFSCHLPITRLIRPEWFLHWCEKCFSISLRRRKLNRRSHKQCSWKKWWMFNVQQMPRHFVMTSLCRNELKVAFNGILIDGTCVTH